MAQERRAEGIVLSSISFKEHDRLVTIFSETFGLLKLYMRGANRPKSPSFAPKEPLTLLEFVFREKRGDFHLFLEGKVLHSFMEIRNSYVHLMSSFDLLRCVSKTLLPLEPHPDVYLLFKKYLLQLRQFEHPSLLVSSFYLKMLLLDGLLNLKTKCSSCHTLSSLLYLNHKDYFCKDCSVNTSLSFTQGEIKQLLDWVKIRSFESLKQQLPCIELTKKVKKLYGILYETPL